MKRYFMFGLLLVLILVACGENDVDDKNPSSEDDRTVLPTSTVNGENESPTINPAQRTMLEEQYELLRQSQTQIEGIWTDLRDGNEVSCATELQFPLSADDITGSDSISLTLFDAAVELEQAFGLWQAECGLTRSQPPADVIDNGVRAALAAGDKLRDAEDLLSE